MVKVRIAWSFTSSGLFPISFRFRKDDKVADQLMKVVLCIKLFACRTLCNVKMTSQAFPWLNIVQLCQFKFVDGNLSFVNSKMIFVAGTFSFVDGNFFSSMVTFHSLL